MKQFLLLFFLVLTLSVSHANVKPRVRKESSILQTDTSIITARSFDKATLNAYRHQQEFQYDSSPYQLQATLWNRFWNWLWRSIEAVFSNPTSGSIIKYLFIALGIATILFVVMKLIGMGAMQIFTAKATSIELPYSESLENIHEISFEEEIERSIKAHNYRLAVRMLYLKCLKKLSDAGMIEWQIDKTNSAYVNELINPDKKNQFSFLTRQFEYVWYGEFYIDAREFQQLQNSFQEFSRKM